MSKEDLVDDIINYDNIVLNKKEIKKYFMLSSLCLFVIGYVFYANLFISIGLILLTFPLKKYYKTFKIEKRREQLRLQFKDLLYSLSASVSAGRQMSEALMESKQNLAFMYEKDEPIMRELAYISRNISESRATDEMLLKDFAYRSGVEEIIEFADIYSTCRATGADINSIISKAAEMLTDKMAIDREIKTIISQKKTEAQIISGMPIIIIVFLNIVSPGYLDSLYYTFIGKFIMTATLAILLISYVVMNNIVKIRI